MMEKRLVPIGTRWGCVEARTAWFFSDALKLRPSAHQGRSIIIICMAITSLTLHSAVYTGYGPGWQKEQYMQIHSNTQCPVPIKKKYGTNTARKSQDTTIRVGRARDWRVGDRLGNPGWSRPANHGWLRQLPVGRTGGDASGFVDPSGAALNCAPVVGLPAVSGSPVSFLLLRAWRSPANHRPPWLSHYLLAPFDGPSISTLFTAAAVMPALCASRRLYSPPSSFLSCCSLPLFTLLPLLLPLPSPSYPFSFLPWTFPLFFWSTAHCAIDPSLFNFSSSLVLYSSLLTHHDGSSSSPIDAALLTSLATVLLLHYLRLRRCCREPSFPHVWPAAIPCTVSPTAAGLWVVSAKRLQCVLQPGLHTRLQHVAVIPIARFDKQSVFLCIALPASWGRTFNGGSSRTRGKGRPLGKPDFVCLVSRAIHSWAALAESAPAPSPNASSSFSFGYKVWPPGRVCCARVS